jgi:hypothetical protein
VSRFTIVGLTIAAGLIGFSLVNGPRSVPGDDACVMGEYFLSQRFEARGLSGQIEKIGCQHAVETRPGRWALTGYYETASAPQQMAWTAILAGPYGSPTMWAVCEMTLPGITTERGNNKRCVSPS